MSEPTRTAGSPTVVFVDGAFADASGWMGAIKPLHAKGVQVMGHNVPHESPDKFADAVLDVGGDGR